MRFGQDSPEEIQNDLYWFLRYLIKADYGGIATNNPGTVKELRRKLNHLLDNDAELEELHSAIKNTLLGATTKGTDKYKEVNQLVAKINGRVDSRESAWELKRSCQPILKSTQALDRAPEIDDDTIKLYVDNAIEDSDGSLSPRNGFDAFTTIDEEGTIVQAGGQNKQLILLVEELLENDCHPDSDLSRREQAILLASVCQEFERRAGQSRSSNAGGVLETGVEYLLDRFGLPVTGEPSHVDTVEIDVFVETEATTLGLSCKRSQRERFRQSLRRDSDTDLDAVWFVTLETGDISEEKLNHIAEDNARAYVPEETPAWKEYKAHEAMYPGSDFVEDIAEFLDVELETA